MNRLSASMREMKVSHATFTPTNIRSIALEDIPFYFFVSTNFSFLIIKK